MPDVNGVDPAYQRQRRTRLFALAEIAGKQWGVLSRCQLAQLGFGPSAVDHALATGRLHSVHRGVYAVGHRRLTRNSRLWAAVLAAGDDAVLSHRSAAALHGLRADNSMRIDVTVPRRPRPRGGITLHTVRGLDSRDRDVCDGLPVTTVARTLLDLAEVVPANQLRRAFDEAERMQILDVGAVHALCDRSPGRRGLKHLRPLLDAATPPPVTRSELEEMFRDLVHDYDLPEPVINVPLAGYEVDALWREQRLVVELDGRAYHDNRVAFEADRARDMRLQVLGYRVLRLTYRRLVDEPAAVAQAIRALAASWPPEPVI